MQFTLFPSKHSLPVKEFVGVKFMVDNVFKKANAAVLVEIGCLLGGKLTDDMYNTFSFS